MERPTRNTTLLALGCALLAANLLISLKGTPAAAQDTQREEKKRYKVEPTNLGQDLEERLNAAAQKGWQLKQVVHPNGPNPTWVVYEKQAEAR